MIETKFSFEEVLRIIEGFYRCSSMHFDAVGLDVSVNSLVSEYCKDHKTDSFSLSLHQKQGIILNYLKKLNDK